MTQKTKTYPDLILSQSLQVCIHVGMLELLIKNFNYDMEMAGLGSDCALFISISHRKKK